MATLDQILAKLGSDVKRTGYGWRAHCPVAGHTHGDKTPSLDIAEGSKVSVVVTCQSQGHTYEEVVAALGIESTHEPAEWRDHIYDYRNEGGDLLYQAIRSEHPTLPKEFTQRRPYNGKWIWHLKCDNGKRTRDDCRKADPGHEWGDVQRVPYRLKELMKAKRGDVVFIVEGEKKCDRLLRAGYIATTTVGGAKGWKPQYANHFRDLNVVILPDADDAGAKYAAEIEASLADKAAWVTTLQLPGLKPKQDVYDWLESGKTKEELDRLVDERYARDSAEEGFKSNRRRWSATELVHDSNIKRPIAYLRNDIFTQGDVSMVFGPSGSGKSYLGMFMCGQFALGREIAGMKTRQANVLFVSEEMIDAIVKERSRLMWTDQELEAMGGRLQFECQLGLDFTSDTRGSIEALRNAIESRFAPKPDVVVIDALADIHTGDENSNQVMGVVAKSIRQVARATKTAIIVIHHAGKGQEGRTGKDLARGASVFTDKCEAVLWVRPAGHGREVKSIVSFEKSRHVVGIKPPSFTFAQEQDEERSENIADAGTDAIWKAGIRIVTAEHVEDSAQDRQLRRVRDVVAAMAIPEGDEEGLHVVTKVQVVARLVTEGFGGEKKCKTLVDRALKIGLVVSVGRGRLGLPGN